jgi:cystathionine gamma-lyase
MPKQFETLAIHAGQPPDPSTGAIMTPVYLTSTYVQEAVGEHKGFDYSRSANPTRSALEACLASLEGAAYGLAMASGMAAVDLVARLCSPGDHILVGNDVYGGTYRIFDKMLAQYGLEFSYVDTCDLDQLASALQPNTRMVWLETPTNPYLKVTDIQAAAEIVRHNSEETLLVVDNTFATPFLQRPLDLGAHIVVHSTTKYLGGHSDVVGGAVLVKDGELHERLSFMQNAGGAVPGPMDCFLILRSLKTLAVRMERHAENASALADYLAGHSRVARVYYPFHASNPQHEIARRQMRSGGGMVSFIAQGGGEAARKIAENTAIFSLAESLGGVESLIEVPALMTHLSTSDSDMAVDPGLVRLSVGIEHVSDLVTDLESALAAAG